jgi:hypothetical protein
VRWNRCHAPIVQPVSVEEEHWRRQDSDGVAIALGGQFVVADRRHQRPGPLRIARGAGVLKLSLSGKTTHAAWRSKPSYYAVSTEDRTINPDLERFMAKRMGAKTIEVKSSHLSLISHPDEITHLILEAAGQQA